MTLRKGHVVFCFTLLFFGCSSSQNDCQPIGGESGYLFRVDGGVSSKCMSMDWGGDYMVGVYISGETSSFEGRRIEVNGIQAKAQVGCLAKDNNGCTEYGVKPGYSLRFCTADKETFLHKPLHLVVYEGENKLWETSYERLSCSDLPSDEVHPWKSEDVHFVLTPGGAMTKNPSIQSSHTCSNLGTAYCTETQDTAPL